MADLLDVDALHGKVFSGGWRTSAAGTVDVTEPATGDVLAIVGLADASDVHGAVRMASSAQRSWAAHDPFERATVLRNAAEQLQQARDEVVRWLIREGGAVAAKAMAEVGSTIDELLVAAELATQPHGHLLPGAAGTRSTAERVPLGVVGVISPWNVPLLLAMRSVAPALALGNAVVLKPDLNTPVSGGHVIARIFEHAGLPDGLLHVLPGDAEPGAALAEDPGVAMITFTGSTAVGRQVGATAGRTLKRVSLELGGNSPLIVLDDADLDAASSAGAWGSFLHQGQICMATGRHIVLRSIAEEYVDKLVIRADKLSVGDPWTEDVQLGPLINHHQLERVNRIVTGTISAGATLRAGGGHDGLSYRPTVLTDVTDTMPAFAAEIFGPVAPVIVVADEREAVAVANRTEYGLSAAIQTGSAERGRTLAEQLDAGMVHVNDQTINDNAHAPFGGVGASGNGTRHGALHSWDEFTRWRWTTVKDRATPLAF